MEAVKIEGLYQAGYNAHRGTSFAPEKRGAQTVEMYEAELNADLEKIPESYREEYQQKYVSKLKAYLSAKSGVVSTMIAGPANFPVARMEKKRRSEDKHYSDFRGWREYKLAKIEKQRLAARSVDEIEDEQWVRIKRNMESSLDTIIGIDAGVERGYNRALFVKSVTGTVKTLAKNGKVNLVQKCLDLIREYNAKAAKPVITERHEVFTMEVVVEKVVEREEINQNTANAEIPFEAGTIVVNKAIDRIQLLFNEKPEADVRTQLKSKAFKWSPTNNAWQRQLTNNAVYAVNTMFNVNVPQI